MIGTRLGHYRITGHLGTGGMGEVYQATDSRLERSVAIKLLPEAFTLDTERVARFQREARVLAALNHPNIASIHGLEEGDGRHFLIMELVPGETLAQRIERGPVPLEEALRIAHQITDALEVAHGKAIVHRDLKPANIKVTPEGFVKVLDFGLAKAYDPEPMAVNLSNSPTLSAAATQQGIILGTAAYMSPEQARGKSVDRRADIWSFGVIFFEMLTGGRLFGGEDITDTLARVIQAQPNFDDVPREVRRLLRKALEKDPKQRLRDIGDAWELLDEPSPEFERLAPTNARSLARIAAAALAFIAAALGFGWWRAAQAVEQPLVQLDLELGEDVSLPALATSNAIAISADGTRLAYVSGTPAKLFVRKLNQRKATELPGTENARAPFFSPDGQWLGFISSGGDKINKISVEGGAVVPLAPDSQSLTRGAWGEDGNIYVGRTSIALHEPAIVRIPSGGGTPTTVMESTTELQNHVPEQVLPGGKAVLLVSFPANDPQATNIQILTLSDHKTKTIVPGASRPKYVPSGHLIYASRGGLFAVPFDLDRLEPRGTPTRVLDDLAYNQATLRSDLDVTAAPEGHGTFIYRSGGARGAPVSLGQRQTIQMIDATGKRSTLSAKPSAYRSPRLSRNGSRLAVIADMRAVRDRTAAIGGGDVLVYDLTRDNPTTLTKGDSYGFVVWAMGDKYLILASPTGLKWMPADGSRQPQVLIRSDTPMAPESVTRDGKLAYHANVGPRLLEIWTVQLTEENEQLKPGKPELFLSDKDISYAQAAFSADGKWLAYAALSASRGTAASYELWVQPFPASSKGERVPISNGSNPVWSPNGELLYASPNGSDIMAVKYSDRDGKFVLGKPRIWQGNALRGDPLFDLDPNGKRVVIVGPEDESTQAETPKPDHTLAVVQNFFDELRRRAPIH